MVVVVAWMDWLFYDLLATNSVDGLPFEDHACDVGIKMHGDGGLGRF